LKKRTKKLLPMAYAAGEPRTNSQKFFASFFKKEDLPPLGIASPWAIAL
jgi:hypothetical protein